MAKEELEQNQQNQGSLSETSSTISTAQAGYSNTPHRWFGEDKPGPGIRFNVCIDYLKVTFLGEFHPEKRSIKQYHPLLEAFCVDPTKWQSCPGRNSYKRGYYFDEHLSIFAGGDFTKSNDVDTFSVEMKGQACRDFEKTVKQKLGKQATAEQIDAAIREAWKNLLLKIAEFEGKCTRIDLPVDDLVGIVPIEELKVKVMERCYRSNMRSKDVDEGDDGDKSPTHIRTSKNKGLTITVGGRTRRQLVVYNKKAEMESKKGGIVLSDKWIRYESRFYHNSAEEALALLTGAFCDPDPTKVPKVIVGLLKGMMDVKEYKTSQIRHCPTWSKWAEFLKGVEEIEILSQARVESTVQTNALWLTNDASKAIARLWTLYPDDFAAIMMFLVKEGLSRFDTKDLFKMNNQRKDDGDDPFEDLSSAKEYAFQHFGQFPNIPEYVQALMKREQIKMGSVRYNLSMFGELKQEGGTAPSNEEKKDGTDND